MYTETQTPHKLDAPASGSVLPRYAFLTVLLVGIVLRIVYGSHSLGFVHPDEHQQYLEAANRIAYGQGVMFWEYEQGIRHYMYLSLIHI